MRVQMEEWRRFIPGVRMYKGKMTLFWNGESLRDDENLGYLIYNEEERNSWEVIIVLPGVEIIPGLTFHYCENVKTVIMSDTVRRIEYNAFNRCFSLVFVRLSRNLEYIGRGAFYKCTALTSIFIPPTCREICDGAFARCRKLIIFHVPQQTELGDSVISNTCLLDKCDLVQFEEGVTEKMYHGADRIRVNQWIKDLNLDDEYELHRACASFNPLEDVIYGIVKRKGLCNFKARNKLGITPLRYLEDNPFAEIDQNKLIKRYVADMLGEPF